MIATFVHAHIGVFEARLVANCFIFHVQILRVFIDHLLNQVVDHRLVVNYVLFRFNNRLDDIIPVRISLNILHFLHLRLQVSLANVKFKMLITIATPVILTTNHTKYLVLNYCRVAEEICLFVVKIRVVVCVGS